MSNEKLKELLEFAKTTDLTDVVWEKDGVVLSFQRSADRAAVPASPESAAETAPPLGGTPAAVPRAEPDSKHVLRSTMVGTFYRSDSKDRPPLVIEGTTVAAGQPVATIEAMKIRKDVLAPSDCQIIKALVENGHAVEYGQPLFEIEPAGEIPHV